MPSAVKIRFEFSNSESAHEPDLAWVTRRDFLQRHPDPEEVVLLVEIAESSWEDDRGYKLEIYAEAALPEYWIVNLIQSQIEVYRQPQGKKYLNGSSGNLVGKSVGLSVSDDSNRSSVSPSAVALASALPAAV